ncbi:hypothetical protein LTR49_022508 [Elasticomyces elasticus]|nr:hypothetical protein LTR49_022508 [Elasticomyces elasticus]
MRRLGSLDYKSASDIAAAMGKDHFIGLYNAIGIPESFDVVTPIMEKLGGGFLANTKPPGKLPEFIKAKFVLGVNEAGWPRRSLEMGWRAWKRQGFKIMDGDVSGEKIVVEL